MAVPQSTNTYVFGVGIGNQWPQPRRGRTFTWSNATLNSLNGTGIYEDITGPLDATRLAQTRSALAKWAAAANLSFSEVTDSASVHIRIGLSTTLQALGFRGRARHTGGSNRTQSASAIGTHRTGTNFDRTVLHEIGHNLGLSHTVSTSPIMYAPTSGSAALRAGDIAGIGLLFPSGAGDDIRTNAVNLGDLTNAASMTRTGSITGGSINPDYKEFRLTETRQVDITLSGLTGNLDLFVEGSTGVELYSAERSGTLPDTISEALGAGTYYIKLDVADASSAVSDIISAYSLQVEVSATTTTIITPIIEPDPPDPSAHTFVIPYSELLTTEDFLDWFGLDTSPTPFLPGTFFDDGVGRYLVRIRLDGAAGNNDVLLRFSTNQTHPGTDAGDELSDAFESSGTITFSASGAGSFIITGIPDSTEPYEFNVSNHASLLSFLTAYDSAQGALSVSFLLPPPPVLRLVPYPAAWHSSTARSTASTRQAPSFDTRISTQQAPRP